MALDRTWYNTLVNATGPGTGTLWDKAAVDALMDAVDASLGTWTAIPYAAGNFSGSGAMTWTVDAGDVLLNRFKVVDKTITWCVVLAATTIGGTPSTSLFVGGLTGVTLATVYNTVATGVPAGGYVQPASPSVLAVSLNAGNWPTGVNNQYVYFTFVGQVT